MSKTVGEEFIRLEHKLDAILVYLMRLTGERPSPMPSIVPGLGGMTDSKCPITDSTIHLKVDPRTGKAVREDALSSGLVEAGAINEPALSIPIRASIGGHDGD